MKVRELIRLLSEYGDDLEVAIDIDGELAGIEDSETSVDTVSSPKGLVVYITAGETWDK